MDTVPFSAVPRLKELEHNLLDPNDVHSRPFVFPGYEGMPFRGTVPLLKANDPVKPEQGRQVRVECLDLSDSKQLQHYQDICQVIGNGFAELSYEERQYDTEIKNWRVLIRFMINYAYMPKR